MIFWTLSVYKQAKYNNDAAIKVFSLLTTKAFFFCRNFSLPGYRAVPVFCQSMNVSDLLRFSMPFSRQAEVFSFSVWKLCFTYEGKKPKSHFCA